MPLLLGSQTLGTPPARRTGYCHLACRAAIHWDFSHWSFSLSAAHSYWLDILQWLLFQSQGQIALLAGVLQWRGGCFAKRQVSAEMQFLSFLCLAVRVSYLRSLEL